MDLCKLKCTVFLDVNLVLELIMNDVRRANLLSNTIEIITFAWGCYVLMESLERQGERDHTRL